MSDEHGSGTAVPPARPAPSAGFDWLVESHQQSEPMAPLAQDVPSPAPAPSRPTYVLPDLAPPPPASPPPAPPFFDLFAQAPAAAPPPSAPPLSPPPPLPAAIVPPAQLPPIEEAGPADPPAWSPPPRAPQPPVLQSPVPPSPVHQPTTQPPVAQARMAAPPVAPPAGAFPPAAGSSVFSFASEPLAPASFSGGTGAPAFSFERSSARPRSGNGPLDWVAFVLAFVAPPVGLLIGIGAVVYDSRSKGYAASIAKAAIAIGAVLTIVLGVAFVVQTKVSNDKAAHAAIVASSAAWCGKLRSNPATLSSETFGWPSPGDTIPASITKMESYETFWDSLAKVAPAGVLADTQKVAATAKSIIATVKSTQTLNDAGNVVQLQNVAAKSGIKSWVSNYCP